ncbi:MAG: hypothetical protein ABIG32_00895 [Candidatus Uhrbacteria bacterium]
MSKTPQFDAKVKAILDELKPGERVCELTGEKWVMDEEEIGWYKKFNVPPSAWHPRVRLRLLHGFASGLALWWKPHARTKKPILSFVHPDSPYQVITDKEWMSEEFLRTGPELDVKKPFWNQFRDLAFSIPVGALRDDGSSKNTIGVDYIKSEDSYMIFSLPEARRCFYSALSLFSEDCLDVTNTHQSRECFRVNRVSNLHGCSFAFECRDCLSCSFIFDCRNCEFCFGATNKRNKKYIWFNDQLSEQEWKKRFTEVDLSCFSTLQEYQKRFRKLVAEAAWPENFNIGSTECSGEYIEESTRCTNCYWNRKSTDLDWCWMMEEHQDSAFSAWAGWGAQSYYTCDIVSGSWHRFCFRTWRCQNMEYCMDCYDCENCFGCVGLRKKSCCIYNVQYQEDDYYSRLDEIKCAMLERGEYGEYFPAEFSQNGLQFSMADVFFGFTETELAAYNAPRFDPKRGGVVLIGEQKESAGVSVDNVPDCLADVDQSKYVAEPLYDPKLDRNFSVTDGEFAFYQAHRLAFPREHFLSRLKNMIRQANSPFPQTLQCTECKQDIMSYQNSTYPDRRVYCKDCYLKYLEQYG